jgi:hypothetical protein
MLLPVLPGPEIIFWPVHEKSSAEKEIVSKTSLAPFLQNSAKIRIQILPANFFFSGPFLSFLVDILASWQH